MKKILCVVVSAVLLMTLMVIGKHEVEASNQTVRVWFSHIERENEALRSIASDFTHATGIDVEIISRRSIFDAPNDLANNAETSNRPDIVFMQAPDIGRMVYSELLLPIDVESYRERFADVALDAFHLQGNHYGIGYSIDTSGLVYNKDLIATEDLPRTWDEFFEVAEALTTRDSHGSVMTYGTRLNPRDMWFNYPIMQTFGAYYFGQTTPGVYNPYDIGLNNQGMLAYIDFMKGLMEQGLTLQNPNQAESHISANFANGELAMMLYGLWNASVYQSRGINYGIAPLPGVTKDEPSKALTTVQGFVVNAYTRNVDNTLAFLDFLLADENQQRLIEAGNRGTQKTGERNPANLSVMASEYVQSDEILRSLSVLNAYANPFPNIPEGPIWYNYVPTAFQAIFYGGADPAEKLLELTEAIGADVARMGETYEHITLSSRFYVVLGTLIALAIGGYAWMTCRRNKRCVRSNKPRWKTSLLAWAFLLPLFLLLTMFYVYPIVHNIYLSFTDYSGINLRNYGLIGFANYRIIFTQGIAGLLSMTLWTFVFAMSVVSLSFVMGALIAVILDKMDVRVAKFYRLVFILPWVIPAIITLLMWRGLLETDGGFVNNLLQMIGLPSIPWLSHPVWARISTVLVMSWFSFPYFMVVSFGMLKSVPKSCYEAAEMDGASSSQMFRFITLPWLFRAMLPILIMGFIMQFNQFGVYILTEGGPSTGVIGDPGATDLLITFVFNMAFNTHRYALAAAYSVIIFIFVGLFALISMAIARKRMEAS